MLILLLRRKDAIENPAASWKMPPLTNKKLLSHAFTWDRSYNQLPAVPPKLALYARSARTIMRSAGITAAVAVGCYLPCVRPALVSPFTRFSTAALSPSAARFVFPAGVLTLTHRFVVSDCLHFTTLYGICQAHKVKTFTVPASAHCAIRDLPAPLAPAPRALPDPRSACLSR